METAKTFSWMNHLAQVQIFLLLNTNQTSHLKHTTFFLPEWNRQNFPIQDLYDFKKRRDENEENDQLAN